MNNAQRGIDLELDPHHPGQGDPAYVDRRRALFDQSRAYRLENRGLPDVAYSATEHGVWHAVSERLDRAHQRVACRQYLRGKEALGLAHDSIPSLRTLDAELQAISGIGIVPAEGLIAFREFFTYLADNRMPCTQYVRHQSKPEYTPEPDVIHDVIGHLPMLASPDYVRLLARIGSASRDATAEELLAYNRLYWFTIEFGLVLEDGDLKVFGAGLLSSFGEMEFCFSDEVARLPLDMDDLVAREYDPTHMQKVLYVIPSFEELERQTIALIKRLNGQRP